MKAVWKTVLVAGLALCGLASFAGPAAARLDPSFGADGVVKIRSEVPGLVYQSAPEAALTASGSIFVAEQPLDCASGCSPVPLVTKHRADGHIDRTYGLEGTASRGAGMIAVDGRERALFATTSIGGIAVTRLTANGRPDASFGLDGTASVSCDCGDPVAFRAFADGSSLLALSSPPGGSSSWTGGTVKHRISLIRLRADGSLASRYGAHGTARVTLPGSDFGRPRIAFGRDSSVVITMAETCFEGSVCIDPIRRLTAEGRFDATYSGRASRELRSLASRKGLAATSTVALAPVGKGELDVFGRTRNPIRARSGQEGTFILRLGRRGSVDSGFGRGGVVTIAGKAPVQAGTGPGGEDFVGLGGTRGPHWSSIVNLNASGELSAPISVSEPLDYDLYWILGEERRGRPVLFAPGGESGREYHVPSPTLERFLPVRSR
jgi:hypothetical protein